MKKNYDTKDYSEQLLTSRQIFRYAVPARTVTKKALRKTIMTYYFAIV